jgi:hypothetical protein
LASLPFFLLVGMILTVNNSCDRIPDAVAGRKTLSVEVGERWTFHLLAVEFFLTYAASLCLFLKREGIQNQSDDSLQAQRHNVGYEDSLCLSQISRQRCHSR